MPQPHGEDAGEPGDRGAVGDEPRKARQGLSHPVIRRNGHGQERSRDQQQPYVTQHGGSERRVEVQRWERDGNTGDEDQQAAHE